ADRGRGARGSGWQPLPVHRLPEDHGRGAGGRPPAGRGGDVGMTTDTRVVGKSLPRTDAPGKVTGTAVYAVDFKLPGMLGGGVVRRREPHARLVRVDTERVRRIMGVRAVLTAADVPDVRYGGALKDETVFARDTVRYVGQPVAAVAAVTPEAAEAA